MFETGNVSNSGACKVVSGACVVTKWCVVKGVQSALNTFTEAFTHLLKSAQIFL